MIRKHTRRAAKAAFAISLGVAIVIGLFAAAFTRPAHATSTTGPTIIIGTKNFPEEFILGELYKQALEAKGFHVSYKENIGSTELIQTSLTSGKINFYPEYTGVIVQDVFHHDELAEDGRGDLPAREEARGGEGLHRAQPDAVLRHRRARGDERDGEEVRAEVDRRPEEGRQLQARRLPGVQDAQHLLRRLHEAVRADQGVVPAARRHLGLRGARRRQGARRPTCFSTDPPLGKGSKYTVLQDPKHVTGFQNVAPIVKTSVATALGSKFTKTVNAVSAKLTLNAIVAMNKAVEVNKQDPAKVAAAFLKANGLS